MNLEKPQQGEYLKKLSGKLKDLKAIDPEVASDHYNKVKSTGEYQNALNEDRSKFKEYSKAKKTKENEEKINTVRQHIENIDTSNTQDQVEIVTEPVEEETNTEPTNLKNENGASKLTPEGQIKINTLLKKQESIETKLKEDIDKINKKYEEACTSVEEKEQNIVTEHEKLTAELNRKIKEAEDEEVRLLSEIEEKTKNANQEYENRCAEVDEKIKTANEAYEKLCGEIDSEIKKLNETPTSENPRKSQELGDLYTKKKQAETKKNNEVFTTLANEKKKAEDKKNNEIWTTLANEKKKVQANKWENIGRFNKTKEKVNSNKWEDQGKNKNYKERIDSEYRDTIKKTKEESARILREIQEKIAQAKIDANPETLENIGPLENNLRDKVSELMSTAKSEEDKDAYQGFISRINNLKNLIKENKTKFQKETAYSPTIENMNKYSSLWKEVERGYGNFNLLKVAFEKYR
jgi:hypothetical protein